MEKEELDQIELRCRLASTGPWTSIIEGRDQVAGDSCIITGPENARGEDFYLTGATVADMDFIANARQDIPRLLSEIKRLREGIS
jgi:hypothetical protein